MDLSIIIVNWNVNDFLRDCLQSVFSQVNGLTFEVIVVDNASADLSGDMVKARFPQTHLIENNENVGFGAANNQAAEVAKGKWLLLLNPDTLMTDNLPRTLIDFAREQGADIVGPRAVFGDGTWHRGAAGHFLTFRHVANQAFYLYRMFPKSRFFSGLYLSADCQATEAVDWVTGACLLIDSNVYKALGGFDPRFFLVSEDIDLCFRATQADKKVYYYPGATIVHFEGRSIKQQEDRLLEEKQVSYRRLLKSQHGVAPAAVLSGLLWIGYGLRLVFFTLNYLFRRTEQAKQKIVMARKYRRLML